MLLAPPFRMQKIFGLREEDAKIGGLALSAGTPADFTLDRNRGGLRPARLRLARGLKSSLAKELSIWHG
jgi:hypothetical protein